MRSLHERRLFVQFIHPGGEHRPDRDGRMEWNTGPHRRKFLTSPGRFLQAGEIRADFGVSGSRSPGSSVSIRISYQVVLGTCMSRTTRSLRTCQHRGCRTLTRSCLVTSSTTPDAFSTLG